MNLDVAGIRARLARRTPPAFSVYGDDGTDREAKALTRAAVLVPLIDRPGGLTVLLTQRTTHLKAHSGQVSFPGGREEPGDASLEFTALREAEEEVGLKPDRIEILARMPDYCTRTGFRIAPVVALVTPPFDLAPDPNEVESVFEVPLAFLLDPANHRRQTRVWQGQTVGFYEMPWRPPDGGREYYIWGATAGMIVNFARHLAPDEPY